MLSKKCVICGDIYYRDTDQTYKAWDKRKCCSQECGFIFLKQNPTSGQFKKGHKSWIKGLKIQTNTGRTHFTSERMKGSKNPRWKGGKLKQAGYIMILCPNHPFSGVKGYVMEHRLIAEKYLKRYLTKKEIVHHINQKRNDNRPENLYLCKNIKEHKFFHRKITLPPISNLTD